MISVDEALEQLFALADPTEVTTVPLAEAAGRVLAEPIVAARDQPPFAASAMDGYAMAAEDAVAGRTTRVIGEAVAGAGFAGAVNPGESVRIFTGAPVPQGAERVVIQEDVTREGDHATITGQPGPGAHIRPAGADFALGDSVSAPRLLSPQDLALIASMNAAQVRVHRRPVVALMANGDELVMPGETPGPDQIIASNAFGLAALVETVGATARMLPIARDNPASIKALLQMAEGADLVVTIGGASVGEHDLIAPVTAELGMTPAFYKVAMRPGKPLMAGRLGQTAMVGLPGNPVSAMVCGHIFLVPMLRAMQGLGRAPAPRLQARLTADIPANGPREHYMRASVDAQGITAAPTQDSALLTVLARSNALLIRPPSDGPRAAGETLEYVPLTPRS
ncbi:MAG: gephyrin-like molybdotransferase Glp [Pseudomonadota bacterium]